MGGPKLEGGPNLKGGSRTPLHTVNAQVDTLDIKQFRNTYVILQKKLQKALEQPYSFL